MRKTKAQREQDRAELEKRMADAAEALLSQALVKLAPKLPAFAPQISKPQGVIRFLRDLEKKGWIAYKGDKDGWSLTEAGTRHLAGLKKEQRSGKQTR